MAVGRKMARVSIYIDYTNTIGGKTMKKIQVYHTLLKAMIALANKKNQEFYHIIRDDNGWYRVIKN